MTDETPVKKVWTRHPGCGWRVFNDPIDIAQHERLCPQLLMRKIINLENRLEKWEKAEPEPTPQLDIDSVAEWEGAVDIIPEEPAETNYNAPAPHYPAPVDLDDDDDDEDLPAVR